MTHMAKMNDFIGASWFNINKKYRGVVCIIKTRVKKTTNKTSRVTLSQKPVQLSCSLGMEEGLY